LSRKVTRTNKQPQNNIILEEIVCEITDREIETASQIKITYS